MPNIVPFQFESFSIRTVTSDESGEILFVASDICEALDIKNATQAVDRLDADERSMFNIGRQGETNVINESGLYSLILGSRKPESKKFKKWLTSEVLPTIRKTGKYEAKDTFRLGPVTDQPKARRSSVTDPLILQYKQADAVLSSTMKAAKLLGTDKAMARVLAVDAARQKTGIDYGNLLVGNSVEEKPVTPTVLGKDHGWTGKKTNINLETAGYQAKDEDGQWLPTEIGKPFCTVNSYKSPNSAHTGYRVLWYRRVLDAMDQTMTERQPITGNVIPMRGATT